MKCSEREEQRKKGSLKKPIVLNEGLEKYNWEEPSYYAVTKLLATSLKVKS